MRAFDLNIEEILEDWEVYHAIREVVPNALDEQLLTDTEEVEIFQDETGRWHIRDYVCYDACPMRTSDRYGAPGMRTGAFTQVG